MDVQIVLRGNDIFKNIWETLTHAIRPNLSSPLFQNLEDFHLDVGNERKIRTPNKYGGDFEES